MKPFDCTAPDLNVSRETKEKLDVYHNTLLKWNKKINLISRNSEDDIWNRHIKDAFQLVNFCDKSKNILDIGSGAGIPGVILSTLGFKVSVVEKDFKKAQFLSKIKVLLALNMKIYNLNITPNINLGDFDIITCRGLGKIKKIIQLTECYFYNNSSYILLKGKNYKDELIEALKYYDFKYTLHDSITCKDSKIIIICNNGERSNSAC